MTDHEDNVTHLPRATHGLRELLVEVTRRLEIAAQGDPEPGVMRRLHRTPSLKKIADGCGLRPFELEVLLLGAAAELQAHVPSLCAQIVGKAEATHPSFAVILQTFDHTDWVAFAPGSPLRRLGLVKLGNGERLTERPVHITERVLHALMDHNEPDPAATASGHRLVRPKVCPQRHQAVLAALGDAPRIHLQSPRLGDGTLWAAELLEQARYEAWSISPSDVPVEVEKRAELARVWSREARLDRRALVIDLDDHRKPGQVAAALDLLRRFEGRAVVVSVDPLPPSHVAWTRCTLPQLGFEERRMLWAQGMPPANATLLDDLAARFDLDASEINDLTRTHEPPTAWEAARAMARPRLDDLAQRLVPPPDAAERLVLPPHQQRVLDALVAQVRHKATVQHRWGLAGAGRGLGTSAMFSGPSGTGKTLAAEAVAARLSLDLYRIDLSSVVSKYIGETEKNLRRVFDAAETGGAVLLFDEADALFGKRTDVRDSKDRHANIEVSYLLQRMENYGGLAVLTTNFRKALDDAFLRRLQFIVEFPFPEAEQRAAIWARAFPPGVPTQGLDPTRLAQLAVPGGNISSIARNAAYLAADRGSAVTMSVILEAAQLEAEKLGRGLTPAELRGWPR